MSGIRFGQTAIGVGMLYRIHIKGQVAQPSQAQIGIGLKGKGVGQSLVALPPTPAACISFIDLAETVQVMHLADPGPQFYAWCTGHTPLNHLNIDCGYRIDIFFEDCIIIENKVVDQLSPIHEAQMLTYLKLTGCCLDLLMNWNVLLMKNGIKRYVNELKSTTIEE
jgi:hypothetical protein